MRKYFIYIPTVIFTALNVIAILIGKQSIAASIFWIICFWLSAFFMHKGLFYGCIFGLFSAINNLFYINEIYGIILLLFYCAFGFYLWKSKDTIPIKNKKALVLVFKTFLTILVLLVSFSLSIFIAILLAGKGFDLVLSIICVFVITFMFLPLIWLKRKIFYLVWLIPAFIYCFALGANYAFMEYDKKITINTSPNIEVYEYLPFDDDTKIVKYDSKTLKLTENLPRIDGAAALFPVYSSFVNAVYPNTTKLNDGIFEYNNTPEGYKLLAEKKTDIFIGVYPSDEQKAYATECNTTFEYTPIGTEAFVFFVHKNNPIENLTTEQIQSIYSGEITNWKQLGGKDEEIVAFQRNEGSGSQSMLNRFMGNKAIIDAPTELKNTLMSGIVEEVASYKSKSNSIGFSFRFYIEGIIKNPDIKMLSVDGVKPTAENIKNCKYPIVTPIYAVTYAEQENQNVYKLLDWILSNEGQYIIEETGYVGIK